MSAYIPMDRRLALTRGVSLPDQTTGAALFADIAGFSLLTDTLVREAGRKQGAEEVTRQLNQVYTALIAHIHAHRGSVVHFTGDAITCWFDERDETGQQRLPAALRAVTAALAMQAEMGNFAGIVSPGGKRIPFTLHAAVVAGSVRRFVAGSPAQQLDVLAGTLLDRLASADHTAGSGEVVVGAEVVEHLGGNLAVLEWRGAAASGRFAVVAALAKPALPDPWPVSPELPLATIESWLPPAVYQRLQSGQGEFLAELRPAAALLLRFGNLEYDHSEQAGATLNQYVGWVQQIAARYEGTLIDLSLGDKGSYLYLAFGALVAHDDEAARAVAAAVDLRQPPPELAFASRPQIGLAWGQLRTGAYGSPQRLTYGALGNAVNLAARLMALAPAGEIWCDGGIFRAARRQWQFEPLPPVSAKGRTEPVAVYRPLGRQEEKQIALERGIGQLVGRQSEIARLTVALDEVQQGNGRLLLVEGEAGIGKSRLVQEFLTLAQEQGLVTFLGAGLSIEQHTPYRAWRDILNGYFGLDGTLSLEERQERVWQQTERIAPEALSRLPLLNELLNLAFPDTERTAALEPALRQQNVAALVISLMRTWAGRQPLVLVLEDAHWLDSLSWELAVQVGRSLLVAGAPLLMVLALRPLDEHSLPGQQAAVLRGLPQTETIRLSLLQPAEMTALVIDRLALVEEGLPSALADFIRQRAEGNPFIAEELLLALREQGVITLEAVVTTPIPLYRCRLQGDLAAAGRQLPDTLQGLILARVDRLPPERQLALKVASVIGRTFSYDLLHHVLNQYQPVSKEVLDGHLAALLQQDLTRPELPAPDLTYIFKHIITQEVAYQTLLFAQRRQLHRLVAGWYEQTAGPDLAGLAPYLSLLAHHYQQAADSQRECHYTYLAAEQAISQYAHAETITYLTRLLALTPAADWQARYELLLKREEAYQMQGNRAAQTADLDALDALSHALADPKRQSEVALRRARLAEAVGDYGAAIGNARQAIALAGEATLLLARGHYEWGVALMRQSKYGPARRRLQKALRHARTAALMGMEANCLRSLGVVCAYEGRYAESMPAYEQALRLYQQVGDRAGESRVLSNLGSSARYLGDVTAAQQYGEQALALCRELGDRKWEAGLLNNQGVDWLSLGESSTARHYFQQALQLGREAGVSQSIGLSLNNLAFAYCQEGDYEAAADYSRQGLEVALAIGAPQDAANNWHTLGDAWLGVGRLDAAEGAYRRAIELRQTLGQAATEMESRAGLAVALLAQGEAAHPLALQEVEVVLRFREKGDLSGMEELFLVFWRCYQVLAAVGDGRAESLLQSGRQLLQERAAKISDEGLRRSFLENVPHHRAMMTAGRTG
jgi:predicted ATPase/class 3 adenylate cyclase